MMAARTMVASSAADPTILSRDFRSRSSTTMRPPQCLRVCHHRLACLRQIHPCLWQCKRDSIRCNGNSISRNSHQRALRLLQQKIPLQPLSPPTSLVPTVLLQIAVIQGVHGLIFLPSNVEHARHYFCTTSVRLHGNQTMISQIRLCARSASRALQRNTTSAWQAHNKSKRKNNHH